MYHQVLKWTKKEQKGKRKGPVGLGWQESLPATRLHLGRDCKDVSQIQWKRESYEETASAKATASIIKAQGEQGGHVHKHGGIRAAADIEDQAWESQHRARWCRALGQRVGIELWGSSERSEGWRTRIWHGLLLSILWRRDHMGQKHFITKDQVTSDGRGGGERVTSDQILRISWRQSYRSPWKTVLWDMKARIVNFTDVHKN